jgi:hypothetical protein
MIVENDSVRIRRALLIVAAALVLGTLISLPADAQVVGATLSGTISDTSGAVLPGAQVSIKNVSTGVQSSSATNSSGLYRAPNLLAGAYELTFSAPGFKTEVRSGIILTVGGEQILNVTLSVGTSTEKVNVTGEAPAVELNSSVISGLADSVTVRELPLNGRSWTDLATLQPGVTRVTSQASINDPNRAKRGLGADLSVSGGRNTWNNYLLDGVNINDYANAGPGSILGGNLGVDAIAEFSVMTSNYSAEYGRSSGGVISAITRSGTNRFHGDVYEFIRNNALDARNFFDTTIAPLRRNQFGASTGGPIRKDKTFFFVDYEGIRQSLGLSTFDFVPSMAARSGNLCAPPDCSTTTSVVVDPEAARFLKAFYPLPNGPLICPFNSCVPGTGDTGVYSFAGSQVTNENYVIARIDNRFSEKDSLSGTYMFDNAPSTQTDEFKNKDVINKTRRQLVTLEENHIFGPTLVNSARFGYSRILAGVPLGATAINPSAADTSFGFVPGDTAGVISVPGLTDFSGGLDAASPQSWAWNSWQGYDNVFLTKGIHSLKFGANVERIQDNTFGAPLIGGQFVFNSLSDFLTNQAPQSFTSAVGNGLNPRGVRQTIFGTYIQDDIRWRPNLTINVGLRYEMASVITEVHNQLSNLRTMTNTVPFTGSPYMLNPTKKNFEPRVGFAWDPFHNGKNAVRAGFGIFDVLPVPVEMGVGVDGAPPFTAGVAGSTFPPGVFPTGAYLSFGNMPNTQTGRFYSMQFDPPRNYVMHWNLALERQLTPNTTASVAYVGAHGVHSYYQTDDGNFVMPTLTSQGWTWPLPIGSGTKINPTLGRIFRADFSGSSVYDALEVQITKRMSHGFQVQGSYTWSKSIDDSDGTGVSDQYTSSLPLTFWPDPRTHRGLSDTNTPQHLSISYTWDVPTPSSFKGPATWVLRGWQIGGIYTASSGQPTSVVIHGDPLGLNSIKPFDFPNVLSGPGCNSLVNPGNPNNYIRLQCFVFPNPVNVLGNAGRNIIPGPNLLSWDFSLFKNNPIGRISDTFTVQFRAEFFNILNRANFQPPSDNNTLFDQSGNRVPSAGAIDATTTTSRQIQFALKVIW